MVIGVERGGSWAFVRVSIKETRMGGLMLVDEEAQRVRLSMDLG